jgi:1-deoxy-D-xylulose-5-phosphate reductoisomerase
LKNIVVLGSTGSIGTQTLDVASTFLDRVRVLGLACNRNASLLQSQVERFKPRYKALADGARAPSKDYGIGLESFIDMAVAPDVDLVVVATVGAAGLLPTMAALRAGKRVALANKETLVMAGQLLKREVQVPWQLVPIDSEHSAIWQCLQGEPPEAVEKIVLTASGGALRDIPVDQLPLVTPQQALRHPTWDMGPKITVDSATLMNKGLEVIEASYLFDVTLDQVEVVIQRESIVHSLVYFNDASIKAQLGPPDMRQPIEYALSFPDRWTNNLNRLDLMKMGTLTFGAVDWERYPCLSLAIHAGRIGGTYPAALCAADEVAVDLFTAGRIGFTDIPAMVETVLEKHEPCPHPSLDDILQTDATVREACNRMAMASGA